MTFRIAGIVALAVVSGATPGFGQGSPQPLTEMGLSILGVSAYLENASPVVPKGTPSGVRVVVRAGERELSAADVRTFLGGSESPADFQVQAELSGPGLQGTLSLPEEPGANLNTLALALPPLVPAGQYRLSNLRIVVGGHVALDVMPAETTLQVVDQMLVTSVVTRPLTLDEIRARGIVLDSDAYLGFEFHIALKLESGVVPFTFPAVFNREGVRLPLLVEPPALPRRDHVSPPPQFQPVLLVRANWEDPEGGGPRDTVTFGGGGGATIPGLLVIPGDVAYLKQFVVAKLYVANGAPTGSGLSVRDVTATIHLPPGPDGERGTADDPLALPAIMHDGVPTPQELDAAVTDEAGHSVLGPHEQGSAEYVLRGEFEGLHQLEFDLAAVLDGVPGPDGAVQPIALVGRATGAVLVRNPFFHLTFTAPTVVRAGEPFKLYAAVTNVSAVSAYAFSLSVEQPSGASRIVAPDNPAERYVEELKAGDTRIFEYRFLSQTTGQVIAKYLRLYGSNSAGSNGSLKFTVGVDERGTQLSPDTLLLPAAVDSLPGDVVQAAMRILGQAWSVTKAPYGKLPPNVLRIPEPVTRLKVLALAEAGLRVQLRGGDVTAQREALRELLLDFYRQERELPELPPDESFDQLMRETEAGRDFVRVVGQHLGGALASPAAALDYEQRLSEIAASGPAFVAFAVTTGQNRAADVAVLDAFEHVTRVAADAWSPASQVPSAVLVPLGAPTTAPLLGFVSRPSGSYLLELTGRRTGSADVSITLPSGDGGRVRRVVLAGLSLRPGSRTLVALDPLQPQFVLLAEDLDGDGQPDAAPHQITTSLIEAQGPRLLGAAVVGPETFVGASEFGLHLALVFDRVVGEQSAAETENYTLAGNSLQAARRQLSGRLVFALMQAPEGPYVARTVSVSGIEDEHAHVGPSQSVPLQVRLLSPGGVVTGRVLRAGGGAITTGDVYYVNSSDSTPAGALGCMTPSLGYGLTSVPLGSNGYSLRYVKQSVNGCPFYVVFRDPNTGARRSASARVHAVGGTTTLDIVLDGVGTIAGQVRNRYSRQPIAGARVVGTSNADPQSGGATFTDAAGNYSIPGITVGPVTVRAAHGIGTGFASGRIASAGQTANVTVDLDDGALSIGGRVRRLGDGPAPAGGPPPAAGALVIIWYDGVALGWRYTDQDGRYAFGGMPAGTFKVTARDEDRTAQRTGQAFAGSDILDHDLLVEMPAGASGATQDVVGHVYDGNGNPAANAFVWNADVSAVATDATGFFRLPKVPVPASPSTNVYVNARSADRRRDTYTTVRLGAGYQVPDVLELRLPGVGDVVLSVLGPEGSRLGSGVEVKLRGQCNSLCGCDTRHTDANGEVRFENMLVSQPLGFHVYRQDAHQRWDYAQTTVTVPADGVTAYGVLRLGGFGTVKVKVENAQQEPLGGSPVTITAPVFRGLGFGGSFCTQANETSAPKTTALETGEVVFNDVAIGAYFVSARDPFDVAVTAGASGTLTHDAEADSVKVTLYDRMAGRLSGRVYGPDGELAGPGVQVTLSGGGIPEYAVVTQGTSPGDANYGEYRFSPILPAGTYTLRARDPRPDQVGVSSDSVALSVHQDSTFDLHLKGRGSVRVHVVDGQGGVARAQVTLQETQYPNGSYQRPLEASAEGVVTFDAVYQGPFSVEVMDAFGRGGRVSGALPAAGQTIDVTVRVTATGCITGRFEMPDEAPIPNGIVKLKAGPNMSVVGQATTQSQGNVAGTFEFDYVPLGQVRLEGHDPLTGRNGIAVGTLEVESHLTGAQPQCLALDLAAESLGTVMGDVTSNGAPQPGIEVEVVSGQYLVRAASDAAGAYLVEGVPAGQVTARAKPPGNYLAGSSTGTLSSEGATLELDVALRDSAEVVGHLLRYDGQAPGSISEISLTGPAVPLSQPMKTYSDEFGDFHFHNVPVGLATFKADALQSLDRGEAVQDVQRLGHAVEVTLQLIGTGRLKGQAQDAAGNPLSGSIVISGNVGGSSANFYYVVGSSGNFVVPEMVAGSYTIQLSHAANTLFGSTNITVTPTVDASDPNDWTTAVVKLEPTGRVVGRVRRPDHTTPAYGANVTLTLMRTQGGWLTYHAQADAQGAFEVRGVPLGPVKGTVQDPVTGGRVPLPERALAQQGGLVDYGTLDLTTDAFRIVSISPADGATNVAADTPLDITFNMPLGSYYWGHSLSVSALMNGPVWLNEGRTMRLTPWGGNGWSPTTTVEVLLTRDLKDIFDHELTNPMTTHFSTRDLTLPMVSSRQPAVNAIQVPTNATVRVTFDEPVTSAGSITLKNGTLTLPGTVALEPPATLVFTPASALPTDVTLSATVVGATDLSGNVQVTPVTWTFKTLDTQAPVVNSSAPVYTNTYWINVPRPTISASFGDQQSGLDLASEYLKLDGVVVPHTQINPQFISYVPPAPLAEGAHTYEAGARDLAGNLAQLTRPFGVDVTPPPVPGVQGFPPDNVLHDLITTLTADATDPLSGVERVEFLVDDYGYADLTAPYTFAMNLTEGPHTVAVRVRDVAGNVGASNSRTVFVDKTPLTVNLYQPAVNAVVRDTVTLTANTNEPVLSIDFAVTGVTPVNDSVAPYTATFDLATAPEGLVTATATAHGLVGETAVSSRQIRVDRTPPLAPDASKITAAAPIAGVSLVLGSAGAVEALAVVSIDDLDNGQHAQCTADATGRFSSSIAASSGHRLVFVARDSVANASPATQILVSPPPVLPPGSGSTRLLYAGILADRVGPGLAQLAPDGSDDAVFTLSLAIGTDVTRLLSYVDLQGPTGTVRSTRAAASSALGLGIDAVSPFLNAANGEVSFPVTASTTLTLFAANAGFIVPGTYVATAVFTDGSRFAGAYTLLSDIERPQVPHSAKIVADPPTLACTAAAPATTVLTLSNIRDIDDQVVPDGTKIAVAVADMASKDPVGNAIRSAGGTITDGAPSANNPSFRVFTVLGGQVTVNYSSAPVDPIALRGPLAVVQVQAADAAGNVLGQKAIAAYALNLKRRTDRARVYLPVPSLYADKAARHVPVHIELLDANGVRETGTVNVLVTASASCSQVASSYNWSAGGSILGGANSPSSTASCAYRWFPTSTGLIDTEYSSDAISVFDGASPAVTIQVLDATATGALTTTTMLQARGLGTLTLTAAAGSELRVVPESLPLVFPPRTAQVRVHHVHDTYGNLAPDGAVVLLSASFGASMVGGYNVASAGGLIVDGTPSSSGAVYKYFPLTGGEANATYSTEGVNASSSSTTQSATLQLLMGDAAGNRLSVAPIALKTLRTLAPLNAVGDADPPSVLADGGLHTATVTFDPVLDAWGSPLPDGSKVVLSVANLVGNTGVQSDGGALLNGSASPSGANYMVFTVANGAISASYSDQGIGTSPGLTKTARVVMLESNASGQPIDWSPLGVVPIALPGTTSGVLTASASGILADGVDRRVTLTLSQVRDTSGNPVPDGTMVLAAASHCASTTPAGACYSSYGGTIIGGASTSAGTMYRAFVVTNGQVVFDYSTAGTSVPTTPKTALVQVLAAQPDGKLVNNSSTALATFPITLTVTGSVVITTQPPSIHADGGARLAQVTLSDLRDSNGNSVPDGAKVALTVGNNATSPAIPSAGGAVLTAGTTPGDGAAAIAPYSASFRIFTVAGGQVRAVYSATGVKPSVNQTLTANLSVVPASSAGAVISSTALATAPILLRGTTSAVGSGPTSLIGTSGTVTFTAIKDAAGNVVPDGTLVAVSAANCFTSDASNICIASKGGTITGGTAPPSGTHRLFTVTSGHIDAVTYSTIGVSSAGTAVVQVGPVAADGTLIYSGGGYYRGLTGGTWAISVIP